MSAVEDRLREMNLALPEPPGAVGAYVPFVRSGNLVFLAGQIPIRGGKPIATGKVGAEFTPQSVGECVRAAALNGLAALKVAVGDLDKVARVVKMTGYVASAPGFTGQAAVLNHASQLLLAAFGDRGRHARVAVGVAELPLGVPVELELIFEVEA
jgi:enamine deaminase RidA (YjgF/YER057c/UK114 family)